MKNSLLPQYLSEKVLEVGFPIELATQISKNGESITLVRLDYALDFMYRKGLVITINPEIKKNGGKCYCYSCRLIKDCSNVIRSGRIESWGATMLSAIHNSLLSCCKYLESHNESDAQNPMLIKDRFVSVETAELLKKIGFPQFQDDCDGNGRIIMQNGEKVVLCIGDRVCIPTQIQAIMYLHETRSANLVIAPRIGHDNNGSYIRYYWDIKSFRNGSFDFKRFPSHQREKNVYSAIEMGLYVACLCAAKKTFNMQRLKNSFSIGRKKFTYVR